MTSKNTNIVIILIVVALALIVVFAFFGLGFFTNNQTPATTQSPGTTAAQALLEKVQQTGSVTDLEVVDITTGTGEPVVLGDTLTMNYIGILPDGTVFDSSEAHGQSFTFTLGSDPIIKGWEQGVIGMKEGGKRLLAIPPQLAYGASGQGSIPPNATLIFQVELVQRTPGGAAPTTNQ